MVALPTTHDIGTPGNNTSPTVNSMLIIDTKYCTSYEVRTSRKFGTELLFSTHQEAEQDDRQANPSLLPCASDATYLRY